MIWVLTVTILISFRALITWFDDGSTTVDACVCVNTFSLAVRLLTPSALFAYNLGNYSSTLQIYWGITTKCDHSDIRCRNAAAIIVVEFCWDFCFWVNYTSFSYFENENLVQISNNSTKNISIWCRIENELVLPPEANARNVFSWMYLLDPILNICNSSSSNHNKHFFFVWYEKKEGFRIKENHYQPLHWSV